MGTTVEVQVVLDGTDREVEGHAMVTEAISGMVRLQDLLSSVDPDSEFSRWTRDPSFVPGEELTRVLAEAAEWQGRSGGRFNPAIGVLSDLWRDAQSDDHPPDREVTRRLAESIAAPRWAVDQSGHVRQLDDCRPCTLNAFAKGWIVDRAVESLRHIGVRTATVNAGGDLRRIGPDPLHVGIEDPTAPYDNQPPIAAVAVVDAAIATSGTAHRGFTIAEQRFGHVIDPRTGWPVDAIRSISVVASDTATADVLATVLGVEEPASAIAEAENLGLAVFIVDADGEVHRSRAWRAIEIDVS